MPLGAMPWHPQGCAAAQGRGSSWGLLHQWGVQAFGGVSRNDAGEEQIALNTDIFVSPG